MTRRQIVPTDRSFTSSRVSNSQYTYIGSMIYVGTYLYSEFFHSTAERRRRRRRNSRFIRKKQNFIFHLICASVCFVNTHILRESIRGILIDAAIIYLYFIYLILRDNVVEHWERLLHRTRQSSITQLDRTRYVNPRNEDPVQRVSSPLAHSEPSERCESS